MPSRTTLDDPGAGAFAIMTVGDRGATDAMRLAAERPGRHSGSRVVIMAADPEVYREIVGRSPEQVEGAAGG